MIKIDKISIGLSSKPVIIAEMSGNHNQSLDRALKIVEAAASAGATGNERRWVHPRTGVWACPDALMDAKAAARLCGRPRDSQRLRGRLPPRTQRRPAPDNASGARAGPASEPRHVGL
mgnify:CR=1 FL=1